MKNICMASWADLVLFVELLCTDSVSNAIAQGIHDLSALGELRAHVVLEVSCMFVAERTGTGKKKWKWKWHLLIE